MEVFLFLGEGAQNLELPSFEAFLDMLVWDRHLKEFVDKEKTRAKEAVVKSNPTFYQSNEETDNTLEDDLLLGTIHMIGAQITLILIIESGERFASSNK